MSVDSVRDNDRAETVQNFDESKFCFHHAELKQEKRNHHKNRNQDLVEVNVFVLVRVQIPVLNLFDLDILLQENESNEEGDMGD